MVKHGSCSADGGSKTILSISREGGILGDERAQTALQLDVASPAPLSRHCLTNTESITPLQEKKTLVELLIRPSS